MNTFLRIILIASVMLSVQLLYAQNNILQEDVIYLKNGSILRGKIVELFPLQTVKIEITGRNILVYNMSEVEKITKENLQDTIKTKGFFCITEMGYIMEPDDYKNRTHSFHLINGYRINNYFSIGGNIGIDTYEASYINILCTAVDIRGYYLKKKFSPYYFLGGGHGSAFFNFDGNNGSYYATTYKGGMLLYCGMGIKSNVAHKKILLLSIGLKTQEASFSNNYYANYYNNGTQRSSSRYYRYNRINLNLGMEF